MVAAIIAGALYLRSTGGGHLGTMAAISYQPAASNPTGLDDCEGKESCVMVYVAPWCAACRSSSSTIASLAQRFAESGDVGLRVIVGRDSPADVEAMARNFAVPAFVDPDGSLWQRLGRRGVPYWFHLDRSGDIVAEFAGTYSPLEIHIQQLELD